MKAHFQIQVSIYFYRNISAEINIWISFTFGYHLLVPHIV